MVLHGDRGNLAANSCHRKGLNEPVSVPLNGAVEVLFDEQFATLYCHFLGHAYLILSAC